MHVESSGTGQALFLDPRTIHPLSPLKLGALLAAVTILYVGSGYLGLQLAFVGETVTLFWPPSGIAFAAMWLGGRRMLPAVLLGAFIVNLITAYSPAVSALVAIGNTASALAAVHVVRRLVRGRPDAGELWRVLWFILAAVLGCTLLSATIGTLAVQFLPLTGSTVPATWFVWWMGDAMGMLIVAPPILLWRRTIATRYRVRDIADAIAFAAAGAGIIAGLALIDQPLWAVELCKLFTLLLSLWAGARFGLTGPSAIALLMALGAVEVTVFGVGPFVRGNFYDSFALVHSYLFAEAVAGMLLAAAIADLRRALIRERRALELAEIGASERIRLLTMISHDLRTPLSGVVGVLQLLDQAALASEQRRLVGLGLRAGSTITALVTDILSIARLDVGTITLDPAPFDPRQSLGDIIDFNRHDALAKGLDLTLKINGSLPRAVMGDRVRFEQLVGNLVANAVAYTDAGRVAIGAHWSGTLSVSVADTGPGISRDAAPHIFEAFTRADRHISSGLGLGLHICQRLTELMGGTIQFRPGEGGGSCFHVDLPLAAAAPEQAPAAPDRREDPPLSILLVENDPIASEVTAALLTSHGHRVTAIADANAAPPLVEADEFDLVLMDIQTGDGGTGGIDATRAIRMLPLPASAITIVALTGDALSANHRRYVAAGLDGVLVKPLTLAGGVAGAVAAARASAK